MYISHTPYFSFFRWEAIITKEGESIPNQKNVSGLEKLSSSKIIKFRNLILFWEIYFLKYMIVHLF